MGSENRDEKKIDRNIVNLAILDYLSTPITQCISEKVETTNFQVTNINF